MAERRPASPPGTEGSLGGHSPSEPVELTAGTVAQLADAIAARVRPVDGLLTADQAAELLNVPASWLLAQARTDRVPHTRLGRYVRFDRAELLAWTAARARGPRQRTGAHPVSNGRSAA